MSERRVRILPPTTLKEIGMEVADDRLGLCDERLEVAEVVEPESGRLLRFAHLQRPFSGEHLIQFLNVVAPHKGQNRIGILSDLGLPWRGKRIAAKISRYEAIDDQDRYEVRTHLKHENDPLISSAYEELTKSHLTPLARALRDRTSDSVFLFLGIENLMFIRDKPKFTSFLLSQINEFLPKRDYSREGMSIYNAALKYQDGDPFFAFLGERPEFRRVRGGKPFTRRGTIIRLGGRYANSREQATQDFFEKLSEEEQAEFALIYGANMNKVIVDLEDKRVLRSREEWLNFDFVDNTGVILSDGQNTEVCVIPSGDMTAGASGWRIGSYKFPTRYLDHAVYPLIAWDNQRRFLNQREVTPFIQRLGFENPRQANVKLGEVLVAYLSPQITCNWKKEIALEGSSYAQRMAAAQVLLWVSLDSDDYPHVRQLLSDENPLFSALEKYAA